MKCISYSIAVVLTFSLHAYAQKDDFQCPDDFGFYPHHISCDKYWKCDGREAELKTCGNGLAFDDTDPKYLKENCDYLHNVDCGGRSQLEPPVSTPKCPRLYGIFPDEVKCDVFWNCWNGENSRYQCSPGLAYDREARVCMWADQVPECKIEEVANGFNCPAAGEITNAGSFSRHAHPDDCRKYYICMEGTAREYGCPIGTVFKIGDSEGSGNCEDPEDVPGCEDYYGDLDLKSIRKSELLAGLPGGSGASSGAPVARSKQPVQQQDAAPSQQQKSAKSRPQGGPNRPQPNIPQRLLPQDDQA
uniref:Chitin-binding type-2 domain-containing protein n=1 Tax=Cacopsylla melanoneura TaxID=428564 RepID=A0A8D8W7Z7_9HEMI